MAWHVTYTATGSTALGRQPIVVDLLEDVASAPASVLVLPIARKLLVEFSVRDHYARGLYAMWTNARFRDDGSPLRALLEAGDPAKIRLRIRVGGKRLFLGVPDVKRQGRPAAASGVQAYTVTFTDGVARRAERAWTTATTSPPIALLQIGLTYALSVIDASPYLAYHPWSPEWTDSENIDAPDDSWFDRVRVKASVLASPSATVGTALGTMLRAFWASVTYSHTYERLVVQYVLGGAGGATVDARDVVTGASTIIAPQSLDMYVSGEREDERVGQVRVFAEADDPPGYAGTSATAGSDEGFVDAYEHELTWTPDYDGDRAMYQFDEPSTSTLAGRVDFGGVAGYEDYDAGMARVIHEWIGSPRRRVRSADVAGLVDPARVLVSTDETGSPRRYRLTRGTWDVAMGITRKTDAFELP